MAKGTETLACPTPLGTGVAIVRAMTSDRLRLAQLMVCAGLAIAVVGCGGSHVVVGEDAGAGGDGGRADAGRDAGTVDGGRLRDGGPGIDGGGETDGGRPVSCAPADAHSEVCPEILCDGLPTWHWDGERCLPIDCGACIGADCDAGVTSQVACEMAHASCDAALCRSTSGTWMWWAEECGHYECGAPVPAECLIGMPVCDCGIGRSFERGVGCYADRACGDIDPLPPERLCTTTGGTWGAFCCNSECGVDCPRDCASMACNCGPDEIFDDVRGCTIGAACLERGEGEACSGLARCEDPMICCDRCGGIGCAGMPTCRYPVCDPEGRLDTCGNGIDAP